MVPYWYALICSFFSLGSGLPKTLKVCGEAYRIEYSKLYLCDEELDAKMAMIRNKLSKEVMLGYFVEAKRNDTLFIESKIRISGNYVIRTNHHYFNITSGIDSTVATFLCTGKTLKLQSTKNYKNGSVTRVQTY